MNRSSSMALYLLQGMKLFAILKMEISAISKMKIKEHSYHLKFVDLEMLIADVLQP